MRIWSREEQDDFRKRRSFNVRMSLFFFTVFVVFAIIIVRTAALQFVEAPRLQKEAEERATQDIPMKPVRGTIFSADGAKLAYSEPTQSLYITFEQDFSEGEGLKNRPKLDAALTEILGVFKKKGKTNVPNPVLKDWIGVKQLDVDNKKNFGYSHRLAKTDLSDDEIAYFKENKNKYKGLLTFEVAEETTRRYDDDMVAVQTIGYVKRFGSVLDNVDYYKNIAANLKKQEDQGLQYTENETVGYFGLEQQYQEELRGKNGYRKIGVDAQNTAQGVEEVVPPVKGYNIWSTINKNVQQTTEDAMRSQLRRLPNAISASAVAMEIDTGKVVAMANMPDFDPNFYRTGSISDADYDASEYAYLNGAIRSKPTNDTGKKAESVVYLGSTIKPLSVLIGLEEGLITPNTYYEDTGVAEYGKGDDKIRNAGGHAYGGMGPSRAIEKSSNTFMVKMIGERFFLRDGAKSLNIWDEYMKKFGLGVKTGVDLPDEWAGKADYLTETEGSGSPLSRMVFASFGQKGRYTTMQLAQYTAMLANKGKRIEPHLVSKITDSEDKLVKPIKPHVIEEVSFPDEYWNIIQNGMKTKVDDSFGDFAYKDDFARKTGTSTQDVNGRHVDNGVFIAYAPRENPKLAVAVMVPEGGFGSESAAPIARAIFDAYDEEYGLDGTPKKEETPNVDGETAANGE